MYSLTRLNEFKTCKLKYYFRYFERAKQTNLMPEYISEGIEAHEIIQRMFIDKQIPYEIFDDYIISRVENLLYITKDFDIEIEKQFYLTRDLELTENPDEAYLTGKIDVLAKKGDTVFVIEFKNGFRDKHEHEQILFYLYPFLEYQNKYGITLTPKNYYETKFSNQDIIDNMMRLVKAIEEVERYDKSEDKDVTPRLGAHCIVCPYRKRCNAFQGTLMAEIDEQGNLMDKITVLETELKELRRIAREKAKVEGTLYASDGTAWEYKPVFETYVAPENINGLLSYLVVDKGIDPFNITVGKRKKKNISLIKVDGDAIKLFLREYPDDTVASFIDRRIKYYRFEKVGKDENENEEEI